MKTTHSLLVRVASSPLLFAPPVTNHPPTITCPANVVTTANLHVTKTADASLLQVSNLVTFTIAVMNAGPGEATRRRASHPAATP